ncbi:hypothetical protein [Sphaerisporangium corydalis]|uniref:Type II toxin-antitoxin system RelE/ParE family toxin n=1 Tax=Sphaerisporangium corydalis TaxID=1441875 RepID=A0ABV9ECQ5_9ACTN|nr:hypothetical protein [Sphaerisporangium corydalis]
MIYRAELSVKALGQLSGFPPSAMDALIEALSWVIEYPADPLRTFPTTDPYVRSAEFGGAGLVTYRIDDAAYLVTVADVTGVG